MELGSVHDFLKGKTILVTGATGFLAKIFVEKVLRVQPGIKKLYLLLRASNPYLATQRLHKEVFEKDLFRVQRDKWGADFGSFISEKVVAVAGDVSLENFGLEDVNLRDEMLEEIDIIVHTAATTKFDERFDIAMGTNTMGAFHVLNFAKNCRKIEILLHVSTAYVCGDAKGLIPEEPLRMDQTLQGSSRVDINLEKQLIEEKLNELRAQNANEETITSVMKNLGITRANFHGWPNTYVFTKAMGEMVLVMNMKDIDIPLIVARPTVVSSTHSEPFPGWIEGLRTHDVVVVMYGKGTIRSFLGHPKTILDVIPADMVINSMIIALVAHPKSLCGTMIYHIGSSLRNPVRISDLQDIAYQYFTKNPLVNRCGKPVAVPKKFTWFSSMSSFNRYMKIRYVLPLKGLNVVNKVFCKCHGDVDNERRQRKIETSMKIVEFYKPYLLFEGIFDDKNAENLRMATKEAADAGDGTFNFDPTSINWTEYFMNAHLPGLVKYSVK